MNAPNADDRNDTLLPGDRTDTGSQTDASSEATVLRGGPSAGTVNEKPGTFGKYELLGEIARGGMGVVYRARHRDLHRTVALKVILGTGITREAVQRFKQEARAAAALDHPNVVPIFEIDDVGGSPYFTMALVEGPNLRGHVEALGVVPIPTVVALFAQIVAGVAHAHQNGIIHRDLKPANVLIDKDGRPRVTDFGLAKQASTEGQLTVTGQVVGTPQYMAPEQARESKDVGPPADVYALGAILYFLLTGKPPVSGESVTDVLIRLVTEMPDPPSKLRPEVPPEIEALCLKCLAKKPEERFPDATALLEALEPITDRYAPGGLARASRGSTPNVGSMGSVGSLPSVGTIPDLTPTANVMPSDAAVSLNVPAPADAPAPNRKPLVFGLIAVAAVLVAAIGFLATRGKKDEVAKGDPPAAKQDAPANANTPAKDDAKPTPQPGAPKVEPKAPAVEPNVEPKAAPNESKAALPPPSRTDFGLKLVPTAKNARLDGDVLRVTAGNPITLRLTADKDCHVTVLLLEPNGALMQIFPNKYEADGRLTAGRERVVPGNGRYTIDASATAGDGADRFYVVATTGDPIVLPEGTTVEQFIAFQTEEQREKVASAVRGVVLKKANVEVSQTEKKFRVAK